MRSSLTIVPVLALFLGGCAGSSRMPLVRGLQVFERPITTSSPQAQRYFDQGMVLSFAFDHAEAIRSFEQAIEIDPQCAMAWWGRALAAGPHINNPFMDEAASQSAYEAIERARALAPGCSELEQDLIAALSSRYAATPPEDRAGLDRAYADAMRPLWAKHPDDPDVGALFAEALMDLRPWDLWTTEGDPQPGTPEIIRTLEGVLAIAPDHPLGAHLYIHAIEASPHPQQALDAANHLRDRVPAAPHLVHMPSHIDIRLGRYAEAIEANRLAIRADRRYPTRGQEGGIFTMYRAHNYHFLVYAAMFDGQSGMAMQATEDLEKALPLAMVRELPLILDSFLATRYHVMVRFGRWEELLECPAPPSDLTVTTALWHYGRTVALASLGRTDAAIRERELFEQACDAVPEEAAIGNNPAATVLAVARSMVDGEVEYRRGNHDLAFSMLRDGIERDDALRYDEPWGWMQPVRHALGALLLEQGQVAEAKDVYREDLALHPANGWSLHGLAECLRREGDIAEAELVESELAEVWARADVEIPGSCFCRQKRWAGALATP